ncbi:MAG TPA: histidine kinase [Chitinophagaceae bacterium]|jgi:ligand-binding sensor domain-containing protein/two-component sensor histidine kinase|nr:histidine kinase [Chitinophagaceae bacterium]
MKLNSAILGMLMLCVNDITAQQPYLKHFTVDDYLPSNEIYQTLQDGAGNLLIASDRGAVRYDGYTFEPIPLQNGQVTKPVYYIYKSKNGNIYFSGLNGRIYRYVNDTLINYSYNDKTSSLFRHPGILVANTIAETNDSLLISYNNDYNFNFKIGSCLVKPNGEVVKLQKPDGIYFDLPSGFYYRQLSDTALRSETQHVFITWGDGRCTHDKVDLSWPGGYIRRLYYNHTKEYDLFWIGRRLLAYKDGKKINDFLFPANILTVAITGDGEFRIGFETNGTSVYHLDNGKLNGPLQTQLKGLSVTCIYRDLDGGTWYSTHESGLFYNYPSAPTYRPGNTKIQDIAGKKGKAYVGYRSGSIEVFDRDKIVEKLQLPIRFPDFLLHFSFDLNDSLIAITNKGFYVRQHKEWKHYSGSDILLLPVNERLVYGASPINPELYAYEGLGKKIIFKTSLSKRIISMFYDQKKQLWIGTWDGLYKYSQDSLHDLTRADSALSDRIIAIKELPDHTIVAATLGNGLALFKNDSIRFLNSNNGLTTQLINSMTIENSNIWLGTNRGLVLVNLHNNSFRVRNFETNSGLPTADITQFTVTNGWLYLKWINHLVTLRVDSLMKFPNLSHAKITGVFVDDKKIDPVSHAVFSYNQNTLTIKFNSINLLSAQQQEYAYTLEGLDEKWHNTRERFVKYTSLPPGNYRFKVQVLHSPVGSSSAISGYSFSIKHPFWHRWWFMILALLAFAGILMSIFQLRIRSTRKKNQLHLELAESQQKALVQLINPHFIFNILNTLQASILKQEKLAAASLVGRIAKLMRLSLDLSREKYVCLEKEIELLKMYFELELLRSPGKFSYEMNIENSLTPANVSIPSMVIQPFIENAIKHGLMHLSNGNGLVRVSFSYKERNVYCVVDDNGIGRHLSEQINRNTNGDHRSAGINITINRLKLMHKQRRTDFVYVVEDKVSSSGDPQGTKITFSMPAITL